MVVSACPAIGAKANGNATQQNEILGNTNVTEISILKWGTGNDWGTITWSDSMSEENDDYTYYKVTLLKEANNQYKNIYEDTTREMEYDLSKELSEEAKEAKYIFKICKVKYDEDYKKYNEIGTEVTSESFTVPAMISLEYDDKNDKEDDDEDASDEDILDIEKYTISVNDKKINASDRWQYKITKLVDEYYGEEWNEGEWKDCGNANNTENELDFNSQIIIRQKERPSNYIVRYIGKSICLNDSVIEEDVESVLSRKINAELISILSRERRLFIWRYY